ncbi:recombinase family protein [uncultured Roseovarius sp.]|uniref:recombinase family protein n=1 Tax=uncultured Roseovarius sp. TaxID=293344 RepID=UPI002614F789|nr:recombinase family protein [uncultured Roseovarius sp.]
MTKYFAYTRVSTVKQGDGVSLDAQRDAIAAYAAKHSLTITAWFEEKETAAKRGRPVFNSTVAALRRGTAAGLIVHKIDRSARNFSDWAMVGELIDSGVDVRFAHESLDMNSRGGRLTADIQAVIAADYVRNLREECIKGIEGRLKQGLYPFKAPIGYLDQGPGKPKVLDPMRAPFVRQAFELYASQQHSFRSLLEELHRRGFMNTSGKLITMGCLENLLNNPFYHGKIVLKRTGRAYDGIHEPIIEQALFDCVQKFKSNKQIKKRTTHNHSFRRLIKCGGCQRSLCGELQKGHVYMRCHTRDCPTNTIRQDQLEAEIGATLVSVQINDADHRRLQVAIKRWLRRRSRAGDLQAIDLQLTNLAQRQEQLTDALLDGLIDKEVFAERKERLLSDRQALEQSRTQIGDIATDERLARNFLELAKHVALLYQMADSQKKRRLTKILFSNRILTGKNLYLTPQKWLTDTQWAISVLCGPPDQDRTRTKEQIANVIREFDL